jgi:uncharacterized protein YacL
MTRRWLFLVRLIGATTFAVAGYGAGDVLYPELDLPENLPYALEQLLLQRLAVSLSFALFGFAFGYVLAPGLLRPLQEIYEEIGALKPARVLGATVGLAIGLVLSALLAIPLSFLPDPFGQYLPVVVAAVLAYLGAAIGGTNPSQYVGLLRGTVGGHLHADATSGEGVILDTSAIIDGRVADVAETGFLARRLIVPRFVLHELQQVADSADALRRNRGRRGLEVLNRLQQSQRVQVEILDGDGTSGDDVDRRLVQLARQLGHPLMTNDFNLNRVGEIQGVEILNLNELANAVKTLLLPGEKLHVQLIQEGKEPGQGVGYLDDGTMIVVEQGRDRIESTVTVTVTRVLQTVAGRMIFATLDAE